MGSENLDPEIFSLDAEFHRLRLTAPSLAEPLAEPEPETSSPQVASAGREGPESSSEDSESSEAPVEPQVSVRYYAVWKVPNNRGPVDLVGVHESIGNLGYNHIVRANGGIFEGIRFKRAASLGEAQLLFLLEAEKHGADPAKVETIFRWS